MSTERWERAGSIGPCGAQEGRGESGGEKGLAPQHHTKEPGPPREVIKVSAASDMLTVVSGLCCLGGSSMGD